MTSGQDPEVRARVIRSVILYSLLTLLFSVPMYVLIATQKSDAYIALMYCPGFAALITILVRHHSFCEVGLRLGKPRYFGIAAALVIASTVPIYALVWVTGFGAFSLNAIVSDPGVQSLHLSPIAILLLNTAIGLPLNLLAALGEEFGWRGFLFPQLHRIVSFWPAALISGSIWALWHWPLILWGDYSASAIPLWASLVFFTSGVVVGSIGFAWIRVKSGSIWPAVAMHGGFNYLTQACLDPMTVNTGKTEWITGEFGIGGTITGLLILGILWRETQKTAASAA